MEEERQRARRRILSALDEIVAQCTVQAELLERQDGAAPVLVTGEVVEWVQRVAQALVRYGEGEYARAAALADITGVGEGEESHAPPGGKRWSTFWSNNLTS
jgi:hypothetical protein